jgi:DNA anti-recombination protein RmuC
LYDAGVASQEPAMPVTAKLSKLLYDRLGEKVVNELVDWFNAVDSTYRSDLRELNELNFARFDAKLEQRLAQFEAKLEQRVAQVERKLEQRLAEFEVRIEQRMAQFEVRIEQRLAQFETRLSQQTRWLFAAWAAVFGAVLSIWAGLIMLFLRQG